MRLKEGYEIVEVIGEWVAVPIGDKMLEVEGIITLSESGVFLWNQLKNEVDINELVLLLCSEYEVDKKTAEVDVNEFINNLKRLELLQE